MDSALGTITKMLWRPKSSNTTQVESIDEFNDIIHIHVMDLRAKFDVHRLLLKVHSPYLMAMIRMPNDEFPSNHILLPKTSFGIFSLYMTHLYPRVHDNPNDFRTHNGGPDQAKLESYAFIAEACAFAELVQDGCFKKAMFTAFVNITETGLKASPKPYLPGVGAISTIYERIRDVKHPLRKLVVHLYTTQMSAREYEELRPMLDFAPREFIWDISVKGMRLMEARRKGKSEVEGEETSSEGEGPSSDMDEEGEEGGNEEEEVFF